MNPADLFKMRSNWEKFTQNHPKFPMFLSAMGNANIGAGSVIEINITTQDGQNLCTNVKLQPSDMEVIEDLKKMAGNK